MLSLFLIVAGATFVIVHLDIICFSFLLLSGFICSICAGSGVHFHTCYLFPAWSLSCSLIIYGIFLHMVFFTFGPVLCTGNPSSHSHSDYSPEPDLNEYCFTPWLGFLGFECPVFYKAEIQVYATLEVRPHVMRAVNIRVLKLQAQFYLNLQWIY
jgi:hypothetical protein